MKSSKHHRSLGSSETQETEVVSAVAPVGSDRRRSGTSLVVILAVLAGLLSLGVVPAAAASDTITEDVSCDSTIVDNSLKFYMNSGTATIKQTSSKKVSTSYYRLRNTSSGNVTSWKAASDGGSVSYSSMKSGNYQVQIKRSSTTDCNGILPGKGNYSVTYNVTRP